MALSMPRELSIIGMLESFKSVPIQLEQHLQMTVVFIDECVKRIEEEKKTNEVAEKSLQRYREYMKERGLEDVLQVDKIE